MLTPSQALAHVKTQILLASRSRLGLQDTMAPAEKVGQVIPYTRTSLEPEENGLRA